jgi:hypothetical protein
MQIRYPPAELNNGLGEYGVAPSSIRKVACRPELAVSVDEHYAAFLKIDDLG